jgi:hypothetical protein
VVGKAEGKKKKKRNKKKKQDGAANGQETPVAKPN